MADALEIERARFARRLPPRRVAPKRQPWRRARLQKLMVELVSKHPEFSNETAAEWAGVAADTMRRWLADGDLRARLDAAREFAQETGPPPVGSFEEFRLRYLNVETVNPSTARRQQVGVTFGYMRGLVEALEDPERLRIVALWPVRHAKTTILEQYVVYRLARDPNTRVMIVCANERMAKERARNIKRMISDDKRYPELARDYGAWLGKPDSKFMPWGATEFFVRGRTSPERNASVSCYGVETEIYGARADLILIDDADSPMNGPAERQSIVDTINTVLINRLQEGGKLAFIGTRCGVADVVSHYMNRPGWWWEELAVGEDLTPLEPQMYTKQDLRFIRDDIGEVAFQLTFRNNPSPEGTMVFTPQLIRLAQHPYRVGDAPAEWRRYGLLDPATGGRAAAIVLAKDPGSREKRVLDVDARHAPRHDGLYEMVLRMLVRHRIKVLICEEQGAEQLSKDFPEILNLLHQYGCEFERFTTGMNKHDPIMGVPLVATEMKRGDLWLPDATPEDEAVIKPLTDDMLAWQPKPGFRTRYDTVMALWFGCSWLARGEDESGVPPPGFRYGDRMPWLSRQRREVPVASLSSFEQSFTGEPFEAVEAEVVSTELEVVEIG